MPCTLAQVCSMPLEDSVTPQTYPGQRLFTKTLRGGSEAPNLILLVNTSYGSGTLANFPPISYTHISQRSNSYPISPISPRTLV